MGREIWMYLTGCDIAWVETQHQDGDALGIKFALKFFREEDIG